MNTNIRIEKCLSKLPEAIVFRHLRMTSGLTCRGLGKLLEVKNHSLICHYESGKQRIPEDKIEKLKKIFKLSTEELLAYQKGKKPLPINYKDECFLYINKMNDSQLQIVYGMLNGMAGNL